MVSLVTEKVIVLSFQSKNLLPITKLAWSYAIIELSQKVLYAKKRARTQLTPDKAKAEA